MSASQPLYNVNPGSNENRAQQAFRRHQQHPSLGNYSAAAVDLPPQARRPSTQMSDAPIDQVRKVTAKVEDYIEQATHPIKPYLAGAGRFLIVVTFLEDALRILTQWQDQLYYLQRHRSFPWGISHLFLLINVVTMFGCSGLVVARKFPEYSVGGLLAVVILQGIGYGLITDLNFFLRNLSVVGGLALVLSAALLEKKKDIFAGIPSLSESDKRKYLLLAGRCLLIALFVGFVFNGSFTFARAIVSLFGLGACTMVAVGFRAKESALFLVLLLSVFNIAVNNFWSVHSSHPQRDFLKRVPSLITYGKFVLIVSNRYDFYQTLSVVGGFILLASQGAGTLSYDAKKKS